VDALTTNHFDQAFQNDDRIVPISGGVPHSDWYHEGGNLEWAAGDAEREELRKKVAVVLDYGYEARWLSRAEALCLEPDINPTALPADEIAYFPREGWIEPTRLIGHLLSGAVSRGAELVPTTLSPA
jgi:glycine/D-amino acid oxidase-like deaminating enzyme